VKIGVFYIQNWSLSYDREIPCLTVWKVLKHEGGF